MTRFLTALIIGSGLVAGCTPEPPPARSTTEFLDNRILLEAAMVRCSADRSATRYDQECMNARAAVGRIQAKEEEARRVELEARSERKRQALRRTQQAAAEARRRADEAERQRQEAEYLAQFGVLPPSEQDDEVAGDALPEGNLPSAIVQEATSGVVNGEAVLATDGGNAPVATPEPEEATAGDLESIREELRRRNDEDGN
jgi:type II secretory pathway pseudopilin PulG